MNWGRLENAQVSVQAVFLVSALRRMSRRSTHDLTKI